LFSAWEPATGANFNSDQNLIRGVAWHGVRRFDDDRGSLVAFDNADLPFEMQRFFVVYAHPPSVRAEHASAAEELLAVFAGSAICDLDNGSEKTTLRLDRRCPALWLRPGVWLRLRDFAHGTVIGVAASLAYRDTEQWDRPNPALLDRILADGV